MCTSHLAADRPGRSRPRVASGGPGFTLVEVVVGLVLLATLIVGILAAHSVHHRQMQQALLGRQATLLADELLSDWFAGVPHVPRTAQGRMASAQGWQWRTFVVQQQAWTREAVVEIVRLQLFAPGRQQPQTQVDVLVPVPTPPQTTGGAALP